MADKRVADLTQAQQITGEDLFVLEQSGKAKKLKGSQVVQYAKDAVAEEVQGVKEYADNAKASADAAAGSSTAAGQKATQAAQSAKDAASAKSAAETAKTDAQAARDAIVNMIVDAVTVETGKPATVEKSLVDNVYKLVFGLPRGDTGAPGPRGATGNGISGIALKSGNHAPGTSDIYTITLTDGTTYDFAVYNGANGAGAGDMLASVYDPQGKRTDVFAYVDDAINDLPSQEGELVELDTSEFIPTMRKITLAVASWNSATMQQTVTCVGILADKTEQRVICAAVDESYDSAWNTCYVQCVGRAADSLTFQCDEIPMVAVEVFVTIEPVAFAS